MTGARELPPGWAQATLGEVGDYLNGRGFKKSEWCDRGRPIVRIQNLTDSSDRFNFFAGDVDPQHEVHTGDLLVSWAATLGAYIWRGGEAVLNQHIFNVHSKIDKLFHYYLALSVIGGLYQKAHGSGMIHITKARFHGTPIALPPLHEQRRIVAELERQLSRLDAALSALRRVKASVAAYRASVLKAACGGRLVPTEAELARVEGREYEPADQLLARSLKERRARWEAAQLATLTARGKPPKDDAWKKKYAEPDAPDTSELPGLPGGWAWTTLQGIAEIRGGITKGQKRRTSDKVRSVAYLRVANVQRGYLKLSEIKAIEATEEEIAELKLVAGDVLFNEGGDRDKLGRGWIWEGQIPECIHQNHVFRARMFGDAMVPKLLSWHGNTFGQAYFEQQGKQTTNLASINITKLGMLPVPLPPVAEQHRIVAEVERRLSIADQAQAAIEVALARAERLRQAILKRAFEGRLVPQDPDDEPASALLERIRRQREAGAQANRRQRPRRRGARPRQARRA